MRSNLRRAVVALALSFAWMLAGAPAARAQLPLFDGLDWIMDRGANSFVPVAGNPAGQTGLPLRQGRNNFNATVNDALGNPLDGAPGNNNPWHAVRRGVWPRTADITLVGLGLLQAQIIDNPDAADPNNDSDTAGNSVRVQPREPSQANNVPQNMAHAFLTAGWTNSPAIVPGGANDYRSPSGGFSFSNDFTQVYTFDYAYVNAIHNDFLVNRAGGNQSPATQGELAGLPYVAPEVYAGVENVLKNTNTDTAVWESGNFNLPLNQAGRFTIDIYSPGDGTVIGNFAHPNVTRAMVRVSYGHAPRAGDPDLNDVPTVDANGKPIKAGVEDSRYSRLFMVDLSQAGWINIAPGGRSPAAFNYNGDPHYQIVVTLYTVTPDNVNDPSLFATFPLVTADAVRFNPQATNANTPGLAQQQVANGPTIYNISPTGRILGPVVGTNKFTIPPFANPPTDLTANDTQPLIYFAREESVPNATPVIPFDPTQPVSAANPEVPDPTLNTTAPVFYCIDNKNSNATKPDGMGGLIPIVSVDRVRWRYVGVPDTGNGNGTASASPLLANVRCRDGKVRPIVYFVTTNSVGTVGHIYALDPLGNRFDPVVGNQNTTTAYWVYPSYRPLTSVEIAGGLVPNQVHDPNYNASVKYSTGVAAIDALEFRTASGALSGAPPFGADEAAGPEKSYVDGDIIANPSLKGNLIVRADTQVTVPGMQSSPMVIDDPDNQAGAQILIVGGMNGRVYTFDAGGRGDFVYDKNHQNDAVNPATGIPYSIPGTTQRYWTWPHLSADAFHAHNGSGAAAPGSNIANKIIDEPDKVAFPSSPAFDGFNVVNGNPFFIGAADGHMFALFSKHDVFLGINNQNSPIYAERRSWVYPNLPSSSQDTQTLGAAPSTPAIFTPTGGINSYLYFTCAGRVYCINAHPPLGPTPTMIPNTSARWVFPFTNNPPFPNPADSFSAALDPGFNGTAPLLVSQADLNATIVGHPAPPQVSNDFCYTVAGDGTVYAIDAFSNGAGNLIATGQSFSGGTTRCSPTASLLTGLIGFGLDTTTPIPSAVFADDDGAIWGLSLRPDASQPGIINGTAQLPILWGHFDSSASRLASASLVNGMIYEGGEDGQLRSYGVGTGADGLGTTLDVGEPAGNGFGISASGISIDLRGLNLYTAADYAAMTNNPPSKTPSRDANGNAYASSANPILGVINPNNGSNDKSTWPAVLDWGDGLYIAGYGVYHAQPENNNTGTHGTGPPSIQVFLTISQPGQPSINATIPVTPIYNSGPNGVTSGNLWPDDPVLLASGTDVSIYGVDDPSRNRNANSNPSGEQLTGRAAGVFPYTFFYKLPILPDASKPFTPGASGYRVTARAVLTQTVALDTNAPSQPFSENSNFLELGQHDYPGLQPQDPSMPPSAANPVFPVNPNQINTVGRRRDVLITNPLAVTVRSFVPAGGGASDMTNGNQPNVIGMGPSAALIANPFEVIGNGNRILNPYAQTNTSPIKALFAPIPMTPHGTSSTYTGVNGAGQKVSAFYVADRSNLAFTGPGGSGRHLRIRILTKQIQWHGGNTSVMNPLPWDLMPNDEQDTRDYPNLPPDALNITRADSGQDAVNGTIQLNQPVYPNNAANGDARTVVPTEFTMVARVPKFQPANVNRGVKQWKLADGTSFSFGSAYTDIAGNTAGNGALSADIIGPLNVANGTPVALNSGIAYPAGGYVGEIIVEAVPNGAGTGVARFNPQAIFNDSRSAGNSTITQAYRSVELGLAVPPSIKMRVVEQTIDLSKLPHGAGYSDLTNAPDFRVPFSPTASKDWPGPLASPWDDENQLGKFFRPFTLVNESNVNLWDVRVGKLMGAAPLTAQSITPLTLPSDQTNATLMAVPYLAPGARKSAGIGIVSSFDHISKAQQNLGGIFPERSLWPVANPYVDANGIQGAAPSGLQTNDAASSGLLAWTAGLQPQPTVHKARVGDSSGIIATVPDTPYDALAIPGFTPLPPKVGLAIPLGTPVGTYSAPVYPFEDNVPLQWQEWLASSGGFGSNGAGGFIDTSHDGVINASIDPATGTRTPIEPYSDPTFGLKVTVREARITGGVTRGTISEIDTFGQGLLSANPYDNLGNPRPDLLNPPYGFNMLPAALFQPTGGGNAQINLYWSTPRQPNGSPFVSSGGLKVGQPVSDAPWSLGYSALFEGLGGWTVGTPGTNNFANAAWWNVGNASNTFGLFPGYDNAGQPNNLAALFPSNSAEAAALNVPFVPGVRVPRTVRYASPAAAVRTIAGPPGVYPAAGQVGYLFWAGQIAKQRNNGAGNTSTQFTETRTFYAPIQQNSGGAPDAGRIQSLLNDPGLVKLSSKPLLLSTAGGDVMFLFWHAGNGSQTQLYYNVNSTAGFPATGWSRDMRLETPEALSWQSDPSPMYHQAWDPINNKAMDVIDVVYTGVLKNRRTVETMMSRYVIDPNNFSLSVTTLPDVVGEQMTRVGNTFTYAARDAAWAYGTGLQGQLLPGDRESRIKLYVAGNDGIIIPLVPASAGFSSDASGDHFPIGRYDPASGLIYYASILGGQIVIDPRAGTVSFPQTPPRSIDAIYVSYTPMVMRLNTSRDESNIVRSAGFGNFKANDPAFRLRPAITSPGSNENPVAVLERDFNERNGLKSPVVVSNVNAQFPRLWVLYRKSDVSGSVKATLYYKALRLMVRLPRPVKLNLNNGVYDMAGNISVAGNVGPYEVDWVRGRVYFTELDEGRLVTINFTYVGGQSGNLIYRVAWGDEISTASLPSDPSEPFIDFTTPEVVLPTDSAVNEGQVTAFQIPSSLRTGPAASGIPFQTPQGSELWVFWTSTRAGTTDLYYETIRPNFYPNAVNQH